MNEGFSEIVIICKDKLREKRERFVNRLRWAESREIERQKEIKRSWRKEIITTSILALALIVFLILYFLVF